MHTSLSADEIRVRAYLLWEAEGRQQGRDEHYWHEAALQLGHERVSALESASIDFATAPDASDAKTAKKKGAATLGKGTPAKDRQRHGSAANAQESTGKSLKVTAKRPKIAGAKADRTSVAEADAKPNAKAETKTEAKAKAKTKTGTKQKMDAIAAVPKKSNKSQRVKEDSGPAERS